MDPKGVLLKQKRKGYVEKMNIYGNFFYTMYTVYIQTKTKVDPRSVVSKHVYSI